MLFKKRFIICSIFILALITACSGTSVEEEIYNHLEETVVLEQEFEQLQTEIVDLEKQEQTIFEQIINIEEQDLDEIKQLSEQATEIIEERFDKVRAEEESIQLAAEEFAKVKDLIETLEDDSVINKANEMYDTMIDRYEIYEELNQGYVQSLVLEEELYTMLANETTEQEDVNTQIDEINESYTIVLELNDQFNEKTAQYNERKKEFYNEANIQVIYDED